MKLLAWLLLASVLPAQTSAPAFKRELLVGNWKVNWEKSKVPNARPGAQMPGLFRQYQDYGDGYMLHIVTSIPPGQQVPQLQLLGAIRYDGKEYATYTPQRLNDVLTTGKQPAQTVSFKVVDAYNLEWADRTNGQITAEGTMQLAPDGKIMTFTNRTQRGTEVLIYEKQS